MKRTTVTRCRLMPLFMVAIVGAGPAVAQTTDPINTERPSFSSSPWALAPGLLQLEGGYQFAHEGDGADVDVHTLPLALLRYGIAEQFELQLSWAGVAWVDTDAGSESGATDLSVGVKWQFTEDDASVPMALFAGLSLPIGEDEFTSDSVDPTIGLFWSHEAVFGTVLVGDSDGDLVFSNALGVNLSLGERTGGYLEYVGQFPEGSGGLHTLNGGVTYTPQANLQWDLNVGLGLNDRATDWVLGAGAAYRF